MRGSFFILIGLVFLLGGCFSTSQDSVVAPFKPRIQNAPSKQNCIYDSANCSEAELCRMATKDGKWDQSPLWQNHVSRAKSLNLNCETKKATETCFTSPTLCEIQDQELLCRYATKNGKWEDSNTFSQHVVRAKSLGLDCGVGRTADVKGSANSSVKQLNEIKGAVKSGLKRLTQLGIVSVGQRTKLEIKIKEMSLSGFSRLKTICESAFTEIQPQKCDEELKSLIR